jgi:hypothetical protein
MVCHRMGAWWWAGHETLQGIGVRFVGRLLVGCKTSALPEYYYASVAYGVSADGAVVVGSAQNAQGSLVPFAGHRQMGWRT